MAYDKVVDSGVLDSGLTSIANKIRSRSGGSNQLAFPAGFVSEIDNIPTGGGGAEEKDVNFYDYDGTLLYSYETEEFLYSEMPSGPSHDGLTFQGWNWGLSDAHNYVRSYRKLNIGAMYITDDGKTRIYIELDDEQLSLYLGLRITGTVEIDWGDGSSTETVSGSSAWTTLYRPHTYDYTGEHIITLNVTNGQLTFYGSSSYNSSILHYSNSESYRDKSFSTAIRKVEMGNSVVLGNYAFNYCCLLSTITLHTANTSLADSVFLYCYSLKAAIIPNNITTLGSGLFNKCYNLKTVSIPNSITTMAQQTFDSCSSLETITVPGSITPKIPNYMCSICYGLKTVVIPDGITSIGSSAFNGCYSISNIYIPETITSIESAAFASCKSIGEIYIPDATTSIGGNVFSSCEALRVIKIPYGTTTISSSLCNGCYSLLKIYIPDSVTSIGAYAFYNCYSAIEYHIMSTTPPTLSNINAFNNMPTNCVIYVPAGSLSAYQAATNWSTYASKMQEE